MIPLIIMDPTRSVLAVLKKPNAKVEVGVELCLFRKCGTDARIIDRRVSAQSPACRLRTSASGRAELELQHSTQRTITTQMHHHYPTLSAEGGKSSKCKVVEIKLSKSVRFLPYFRALHACLNVHNKG